MDNYNSYTGSNNSNKFNSIQHFNLETLMKIYKKVNAQARDDNFVMAQYELFEKYKNSNDKLQEDYIYTLFSFIKWSLKSNTDDEDVNNLIYLIESNYNIDKGELLESIYKEQGLI